MGSVMANDYINILGESPGDCRYVWEFHTGYPDFREACVEVKSTRPLPEEVVRQMAQEAWRDNGEPSTTITIDHTNKPGTWRDRVING